MKTIYRSKNSRGRNRTIVFGVFAVSALAFLVISGLYSKMFYQAMATFARSEDGVEELATNFISLFESRVSLGKENARLREELEMKDALLLDRAIIIKENADLRAATHFKAETKNTLARILSKPPFTPFDVLVVDAGESSGVKIGDRVMIGQTYLGTVTLVSSNSSQVTLLSSSSHQEDAFIGDDALPIILRGRGGGNFQADLPQGSDVHEGDLVFAYYLQTPYYVGTASKIISNEDNTFMNILITLPANIYSLTNVEIISS